MYLTQAESLPVEMASTFIESRSARGLVTLLSPRVAGPQGLDSRAAQSPEKLLSPLHFVNSAAVNSGVHVSFLVLVSSGYMLRSGIAESYGGFILSFF